MTQPVVNLAADLIGTVVDAAHYAPRSKQIEIGPSELGTSCARKIAYKLSSTGALWRESDPWASIIGTAVHGWLEVAFAAANNVMDEPRWLTERRVFPGEPISRGGSCDLYDLLTDTVIDHKVIGPTSYNEYKRNGPSDTYRVQGHTYGLGWEKQGRAPKTVAIAFWPRSGNLSGLYLWQEPYNRDIALKALARVANIQALAKSLDIKNHREQALHVPSTPSGHCRYCPYKSTRPGDNGCPDAPKGKVPTEIDGIT